MKGRKMPKEKEKKIISEEVVQTTTTRKYAIGAKKPITTVKKEVIKPALYVKLKGIGSEEETKEKKTKTTKATKAAKVIKAKKTETRATKSTVAEKTVKTKRTTKSSNPQVVSIFDYIVKVEGDFAYEQKQMFVLAKDPQVKFLLISATKDSAFLLSNARSSKIGDEVVLVKSKTDVRTSSQYYGKIINIYGDIVLPQRMEVNLSEDLPSSPIFKTASHLMSVKTLNEQLYTGITIVDLLIPVGKGQRELIIGDRQTGKTHIALNSIINASKNGIKSVYVAIGQKRESVSRVYKVLEEHGALKNTIILYAPGTNVYEQYLSPYIGMAHAENISKDEDVLIIFDDLTKHANIFREIALLTNKPVGKEAMPGNMFFAHSSLLERAGSFEHHKTITALPIVQTIDGDITSLISSNTISITDGQIVTSSELFSAGNLPAIDIDLSVSRTGSMVQSRTMTKVAADIGKTYRKYKQHLKLAMLDYDFNEETTQLLYKGKMIDKMFLQRGFSLYSQRFLLLMSKLISWNILSGIKDEQKALEFLNVLIDTNEEAHKAFETIRDTADYDDNIMRGYFAYALQQYSNYVNLGWVIKLDHKYVNFEDSYLEELAKTLGDK
ncbi:ATP F0F1 synthase subunit alpha [Mycoplasma enhydrae]|uniref:MSC_0619 family F1-like ATPase alpha subunit n=1 Tax=Mycoplasma enhydrae TaxID=2499220 RepID=UPI0021E70128|nr:ATP F0F1 synthase subunit alpha [Mycoplasma enhydrae]MCV3753518.1 ATP F0F1 synthase subunit alpha [Mycoplasma enhydrae]